MALKEKHASLDEVRYIGLFSVIELEKDRKSREPLALGSARSEEMRVMSEVLPALRERGLSTFVKCNWVFMAPLLCVTERS